MFSSFLVIKLTFLVLSMDEGINYACDKSSKNILLQATVEVVRQVFYIGKDVFRCKSNSAIANVRLSVTDTPQPLGIIPISQIQPIRHHDNQPPCPPPSQSL